MVKGTVWDKIKPVAKGSTRLGGNMRLLHDYYDRKKNASGKHALREVFGALVGKGVQDLRDITDWRVVDYKDAPVGEKSGESNLSGHKLRWKWDVAVSYGDADGEITSTVITVSNKHLDTIPTLLEGMMQPTQKFVAILEESESERRVSSSVKKLEDRLTKPRRLSTAMRKVLIDKGIDPDALAEATEVLRYGPNILKGKVDALYAIDPTRKGGLLARLRSARRTNKIDDSAVMDSYLRVMNPHAKSAPHDLEIVRGWAYQNITYPTSWLMGGLEKDLEFLMKNPREGYDVDVDREFTPARMYNKARIEPRVIHDVLGGEATMADAIGILRAFPGLRAKRRERNKEQLIRQFGLKRAWVTQFDGEVCDTLNLHYDLDKRQLKKKGADAITYTRSSERKMLKTFFRAMKGSDSRVRVETLLNTLPMEDAEDLFGKISLLYHKIVRGRGEKPDEQYSIMKKKYMLAVHDDKRATQIARVADFLSGAVFTGSRHEREMIEGTGLKMHHFSTELRRLDETIKDVAGDLIAPCHKKYDFDELDVIDRLEAVLGQYVRSHAGLRHKLGFIYDLKEHFDLNTSEMQADVAKTARYARLPRFDITKLVTEEDGEKMYPRFLSPGQVAVIENIYDTLIVDGKVSQIQKRRRHFFDLAENIQKIRHAAFYSVGDGGMFFPQETSPFRVVHRPRSLKMKVGGIELNNITTLADIWKTFGEYEAHDSLDSDFYKKLDTILEDDALAYLQERKLVGHMGSDRRAFFWALRDNEADIYLHHSFVSSVENAHTAWVDHQERRREYEIKLDGQGYFLGEIADKVEDVASVAYISGGEVVAFNPPALKGKDISASKLVALLRARDGQVDVHYLENLEVAFLDIEELDVFDPPEVLAEEDKKYLGTSGELHWCFKSVKPGPRATTGDQIAVMSKGGDFHFGQKKHWRYSGGMWNAIGTATQLAEDVADFERANKLGHYATIEIVK